MNDRDRILGALAGKAKSGRPLAPKPSWVDGCDISDFERRFTESGGKIAELQALLTVSGRVWVEDGLRLELGKDAVPTSDVWEADVAITGADLAIAETGSLVFANNHIRPRLASLAPEIHVALLEKGKVVSSLEHALSKFKDTFVVVAGPSRTADIEGVIVRGAHGPRELWLIWTD